MILKPEDNKRPFRVKIYKKEIESVININGDGDYMFKSSLVTENRLAFKNGEIFADTYSDFQFTDKQTKPEPMKREINEALRLKYKQLKEEGWNNIAELLEEKYPELLTPALPTWDEVLKMYYNEYGEDTIYSLSKYFNQTKDAKIVAIAKLLICTKVFDKMYPLDWKNEKQPKSYFYLNCENTIGIYNSISCKATPYYFHKDIIDHVRTILGDECIINSLM